MLHCKVLQLHVRHSGDWCVCVCSWKNGKRYRDMTIRKSIVVLFLPCLVAFLAFHPYMFFVSFFFLGGWAEKSMDHCVCAASCSL